MGLGIGDWGLRIGDCGLGIVDWGLWIGDWVKMDSSNTKPKHWKKLSTDAQLPPYPLFGTPPPVKPPRKIYVQVTVGLSSQDELREKCG